MTQLKRSRFFVVVFEDEPVMDLAALLRGRVDLSEETRLSAVSALTEAAESVTVGDLELLGRVPSRGWSPRSRLVDAGAPGERLDALVGKGLLISDSDDPEARRLRQREERFEACQWHPYAAFYHLMIKRPAGLGKEKPWVCDIARVAAGSQDVVDDFVAKHGPPPPAFHEVRGDGESVTLPAVDRQGGLYRALAERKTVRAFDTNTPMRAQDLAAVLYQVFGCHGHTKLSKSVSVLHKTSPSGGSLHPVEVYPLVQNVAGVATGLYHYRVRDHSLTRIRRLEAWEAEAMAVGMAAGHDFAASTHVLFLMTARFERNFWKYRRNVKTHSVVLQDAAHLSQTLYLVCADLGLGAYFIAHDASFVDEALGLDGIAEGAVALAGCGVRLQEGLDHSLDFAPYTPGETEI